MEHIRPPKERPPTAIRPTGTESRSASDDVARRTVWMDTAGVSGRRLPSACPGNSTRSTAMPRGVTASSMATSPEWSRPALAPGVSTRPATRRTVIGPSWPDRSPFSVRDAAAKNAHDVLADPPVWRPRCGGAGPAARGEHLDGGSVRAPAGRQARPWLPRRGGRASTAARRARRPAGARARARGGRPPGDHRDRPDAGDARPRGISRPGAGPTAPRALPAVGRRLVVDRVLPRRPGVVSRRFRLLRSSAPAAVRPFSPGGGRATGHRPAGGVAPARWTRARPRRPLVGQRVVRDRRPVLAHRPVRPWRSPGGGPRHAGAVRSGAAACAAGPIERSSP